MRIEDEEPACQKIYCRFAAVPGCSTRWRLLLFSGVELQVCLLSTLRVNKLRISLLCNCNLWINSAAPSSKKVLVNSSA